MAEDDGFLALGSSDPAPSLASSASARALTSVAI
jgi:hypothetical protein